MNVHVRLLGNYRPNSSRCILYNRTITDGGFSGLKLTWTLRSLVWTRNNSMTAEQDYENEMTKLIK